MFKAAKLSQDLSVTKSCFEYSIWILSVMHTASHHHHHPSLNREGRLGTTDDLATSFLNFSLFSTALWDFRTPGLFIPWYCLPTSFSVCLVFFPFHCALQDGFGQYGSNMGRVRETIVPPIFETDSRSGRVRQNPHPTNDLTDSRTGRVSEAPHPPIDCRTDSRRVE